MLLFLYFIPMFIIWILVACAALFDGQKTTRKEVLIGLGISLVPLMNVLFIILLFCMLASSAEANEWLDKPIKKSKDLNTKISE